MAKLSKAELLQLAVEVVSKFMDADAPSKDEMKATLIEARDAQLAALAKINAALELVDNIEESEPQVEPVPVEEEPVKEDVVPPNPPILSSFDKPEKKPGKWSKIWGVTKKVLPWAGTAAAIGLPGGHFIKEGVDVLVQLGGVDPSMAVPVAQGAAGSIVAAATAAVVKSKEK